MKIIEDKNDTWKQRLPETVNLSQGDVTSNKSNDDYRDFSVDNYHKYQGSTAIRIFNFRWAF